MTEKDIQKISEEYKDEKAPLYEKIHERVEGLIERQAKKRKRIKTFYKIFPVSLAMVLIICLAVILPTVLQPGNPGQPGDPGQPDISEIRYSDVDLDSVELNDTLKEYGTINHETYLYIDMYEIAEDLVTRRYFKKDDESVTVYMQEYFVHGETNYSVTLSVIKNNIIVEQYEKSLVDPQEMTINDVTVTYRIARVGSSAQFEYLGYKYYLDFDDAVEVEFITDLITNMFETQQAVA